MSQEHYAKSLQAWLHASSVSGSATPAACHRLALDLLAAHAPAAAYPLLAAQVATKQYSARLEYHKQAALHELPSSIAASSCCVLAVAGKHITTADSVAQAVNSVVESMGAHLQPSRLRASSTDAHIAWQSPAAQSAQATLPTVLYGPPGMSCFQELYSATQAALQQHSHVPAQLSVRPVALPGCAAAAQSEHGGHVCAMLEAERPTLSGYGVQLALKDMEYSQVSAETCFLRSHFIRTTSPCRLISHACSSRHATAGRTSCLIKLLAQMAESQAACRLTMLSAIQVAQMAQHSNSPQRSARMLMTP